MIEVCNYELNEIVKLMYDKHEEASNLYKKSQELDYDAREYFNQLVYMIADKYDLKISVDKSSFYDVGIIPEEYLFESKREECWFHTDFNRDFEGEFNICFAGKLSDDEICEIKGLLDPVSFGEISGEVPFYDYYIFEFIFYECYGDSYQGT